MSISLRSKNKSAPDYEIEQSHKRAKTSSEEISRCSIHSETDDPSFIFLGKKQLKKLESSQFKTVIENIKNIDLFEKLITMGKNYLGSNFTFRHPAITLTIKNLELQISSSDFSKSEFTNGVEELNKSFCQIFPEALPLGNNANLGLLTNCKRFVYLTDITSLKFTCLNCRQNELRILPILPELIQLISEY
ncbi:MAG: hypothetical protein V4487_06985 [Chlamydiota bacterium]